MPRYYFNVIDAQGRKIPGSMDAESEERLVAILAEKGQTPLSISLRPEGGEQKMARKLKPGRVTVAERARLATQLARLVEAGCPMDRSLQIAESICATEEMAATLSAVRQDVQQGATLGDSLGKHPNVFSPLFIASVKAGEEGGFLAKAFARLSEYEQRTERLEHKVRQALVYPAFMVATLVVCVSVMFVFVVPSLTNFFTQMNMQLPPPTILLIWISDNFGTIFEVVASATVILGLLYWRFGRSESARAGQDRLKLKLPVVGDLVRKVEIARFSGTLALLLDGGVALTRALETARDVLSNRVYVREVESIAAQVTGGESLSHTLEVSPAFPVDVTGQVKFGEEVGRLAEVLDRVAADYQRASEDAVETMVGLIEPLMIATMGGIMGFVVISLFWPLVSMVSQVQ